MMTDSIDEQITEQIESIANGIKVSDFGTPYVSDVQMESGRWIESANSDPNDKRTLATSQLQLSCTVTFSMRKYQDGPENTSGYPIPPDPDRPSFF